ncbi:hypothetical protein ACJX0J_012420 [Zea mays]
MDWQIPTGQNLEKNKNRMVPLTHNSEGIKNKENEEEFEEEEGVEEILKVIEENENRKRAISPFIGISSHVAPQKTRIYIVVVSICSNVLFFSPFLFWEQIGAEKDK